MRAFPALPLAALLALTVLSGCADDGPAAATSDEPPAPVAVPDPLVLGPHGVTPLEYDFGLFIVDDPELVPYRYPVPLHGSLHLPNGDGPFPVVLLMHGRHSTCEYAGQLEFLAVACADAAPVMEPVDSYTGYDGLAQNLASWGYAVASIDANAINDRDLLGDAGANARAAVVLRTLDELAAVHATGAGTGQLAGRGLPASAPANTPARDVSAAQGKLDLSRVGLMGHSRGGEGVARAVSLDQEDFGGAHGLDAVFALAPTDFARWLVPGVAFATLLPYCDGDVYNLQGAWMYDDARRLEPAMPRHQVLAMGANHNFYNTVWTGDDWGTTGEWCGSDVDGSGRDSPEQQRAHGDGLMASFFRLYVGGETAFEGMWQGAASAWPASLCPGFASCDGRLYASAMPTRRLELTAANAQGLPPLPAQLKTGACEPAECDGQPVYAAGRLAQWECDMDGTATWRFPDGLAGWTALSMRVGGRSDAGPDLWLELVPGGSGSPITFPSRPGDTDTEPGAKTVLSEVRFPLTANGVDPADVRELVLHCSGEGALLVTDLMLV